jgi:hypothetical protein
LVRPEEEGILLGELADFRLILMWEIYLNHFSEEILLGVDAKEVVLRDEKTWNMNSI